MEAGNLKLETGDWDAGALAAALAEYERLNHAQWKASEDETRAREALDMCLAKERRTLKRLVGRIVKQARTGWQCVDARVYANVDHSRRPYTFAVTATVRMLFCDGKRRGHVELYGDWSEKNDMLRELRKCVVGAERDGEG